MEKIKQEQIEVLKKIFGRKWKKFQVNEIKWNTIGFKIKDGDIIGLSIYKLKILPEPIGDLSSLKELSLSVNQLTTLPESIGNLKSLQKLTLWGNKLTTLPGSIGNLKSLQKLYLENNNLTTLPESIGNLTSLIELGLENNKLTTLPESIGNLKSLQKLTLWGNKLTTLLGSIGNLTSLIELSLENNKLTTLPESIGDLTSLQELYLENNKLTTLPESIGNLKSLKRLDLEGNPLNQEFKKIIKMANGDIQFILRKIFEKEVEKKERSIIEKLIREMKFSNAVLKLKDIKNTAKRYNLSDIISWTDEKLDLCNKLKKTEKTESLKKKFPMIEKLIREMKFSNAIRELNNIRKIAKKNSLDEILSWTEKNLKLCNKSIIKKTVLELGIKFARLQIAEILEVCNVDDIQLIVDIVKDMIDNKEIYAQYFSSTKSVAFDQQANIDEIDRLMATYNEWEEKGVGKK